MHWCLPPSVKGCFVCRGSCDVLCWIISWVSVAHVGRYHMGLVGTKWTKRKIASESLVKFLGAAFRRWSGSGALGEEELLLWGLSVAVLS